MEASFLVAAYTSSISLCLRLCSDSPSAPTVAESAVKMLSELAARLGAGLAVGSGALTNAATDAAYSVGAAAPDDLPGSSLTVPSTLALPAEVRVALPATASASSLLGSSDAASALIWRLITTSSSVFALPDGVPTAVVRNAGAAFGWPGTRAALERLSVNATDGRVTTFTLKPAAVPQMLSEVVRLTIAAGSSPGDVEATMLRAQGTEVGDVLLVEVPVVGADAAAAAMGDASAQRGFDDVVIKAGTAIVGLVYARSARRNLFVT